MKTYETLGYFILAYLLCGILATKYIIIPYTVEFILPAFLSILVWPVAIFAIIIHSMSQVNYFNMFILHTDLHIFLQIFTVLFVLVFVIANYNKIK